MTTATNLRQRLERVEARRDDVRRNGYDLTTWTDEQLEAVACTFLGLPDGTRLTDEQLQTIIGTPK